MTAFTREINTSFANNLHVLFEYHPLVPATFYEPEEPEELTILSVYSHDCETIGDWDESEFMEIRDCIFKLMEEENKMTDKDKPTVKFKMLSPLDKIVVGRRADVFAIDHPLLGCQWVNTSTVMIYDEETGNFETRNTKYVLKND